MFAFYFIFVLFCFGGKSGIFASLVRGDDQSKCKWIFGQNLSH